MNIELIQTYDYRPCEVDGHKAIFHKWEEYQKPLEAGLTIGSPPAGQFLRVYGIVEFETGEVERVEPFKIVFTDFLCKKIWKEYATKDKLGGAKVVDREQFEKAVEELSEERKYWAMDITDWFEMLEEKLFGGVDNETD